MPKRYAAYLVRHWVLADGRERVEVRIVATGESHRCRSLAEAHDWLRRQGSADQHADAPETTADPSHAPPLTTTRQ